MEMTPTISKLANALLIFQVKVEKIKKDSKNPFFKSNYASLTNILDAIQEPLTESGLVITQFPSGANGLHTLLIHAESGEFISDYSEMGNVTDNPQQRGSCITYQKRYSISSVLSLNFEEDDDANMATHTQPDKPQGIAPNPTQKQYPPDNNPWLNKNTKEFEESVAFIKGGGDISELRKKFKISNAIQTELLKNK